MLQGRIELSDEEEVAVDALATEYQGTISRRDPGDKGPVLFKARNGAVFEISVDGAVSRVKEASRG